MTFRSRFLVVVLLFSTSPASLRAADAQKGEPIPIRRAPGPIVIDGSLSDAGWADASKVETWYETNPGDNVPPLARSVGYLTYDDRFLYAAFAFSDPEPAKIRAPFGERDNISGSIDYGGVIVNPQNDGKTGYLFLTSTAGIQYDAVRDDVTGNEDSSPDFYWDSIASRTADGWILEMRIPFSSLRYPKGDPQSWGILLYRNYPRDFRRQMFSAKLPRGENCFICHSNPLVGLQGLPSSGHVVAAPYVTAKEQGSPRDDLGSPLKNGPLEGNAGLDVKWNPNAVTAIDATVNPDFSQIESDVAQIAANERFALFYPEKRPFFLEGVELFSTPIQAVYTRTITSPRWGVRATGKVGPNAYTVLVAQDRGGGSVIVPGPNGSDFADQDFSSTVSIARVRHDLGRSFASFLVTDREVRGGGSNRVLGPDFQWRPSANDSVTGQLLFSHTVTPDRPDLAAEWDGRVLSGHAGDISWSHSTKSFDLYTEYKDFGREFRADDGFVPQTGFREGYGEAGYTFRPTGFCSRVRAFFSTDYTAESDGALLDRLFSPGVGMDAKGNSFARFRLEFEKVRAGDKTLSRTRLLYSLRASPSNFLSQLSVDGSIGEEVDFSGARPGHGGRLDLNATLRPTNHLALELTASTRWLSVRPLSGGDERRLFNAYVERLKATYTATSRMSLRLILQYVGIDRDLALSPGATREREGSLSSSALFSYKVNWQTVLFLGYGDSRALSEDEHLERSDRQLFLKVSYAFQR